MTRSLGVIFSMLHQRKASLCLEQGAIRINDPKDALSDADLRLLNENELKLTRFLAAKSAPRFAIKPASETVQIRPTMLQDVWRRLCLRSNNSIPDTTIPLLFPLENASEGLALEIMTRLISRHDALRFRFSEFDTGRSAAFNEPATFNIQPTVDVANAEELARAVRCALSEEVGVLDSWLIRARVISGPENGRYLVVLIHHAICDAHSVTLIRRDILTLLRGGTLSDCRRTPFIDLLHSEHSWVKSEAFVPLADFWRQWGSEIPSFVITRDNKLLTCRPGTVVSFAVQPSRNEVEGLFRAGRQPTGFRSLLALFAVTLSEWAGIRRFSIRSMRNVRSGGPLSETVGLLMRHDYVDIDLQDKMEFSDAATVISQDFNCTMSISIPTGVYGDMLDFDKLGYKVAPIINYVPTASPLGWLRGASEGITKLPRIIGVREYKIPAAPIFLRVKHSLPLDVFFQLDVNSAVVSQHEGQRLAEGLLINLQRIAASAASQSTQMTKS